MSSKNLNLPVDRKNSFILDDVSAPNQNSYSVAKESESQKRLRIEGFSKLNIIKKGKVQLILKSKELISSIKKELAQSLAILDAIGNSYLDILKKKKFDASDMGIINKILKMELKMKLLDTIEIENQIYRVYSQEFASYVANESEGRKRFLNKHVGGFQCGAIMRDDKTLVTGGSDSVVRVWDIVQKIQLFTLHGHNSIVNCLTLTRDSRHIISGSSDASVRIWSFQEKAQVGIFRGHKSKVFAVYYVERPPSIVSGDYDGELIIWDFTKLAIIKKLNHPRSILKLILTRNQFNLIAGSVPDILIYEFGSDKKVSTMEGHTGAVRSLSLTSNEKKLVSGSSDNFIIIWDMTSKKEIVKLAGHIGTIKSIVLTSDDLFIVSGSNDKTVRLWSMQTGKQENMYSHNKFVNSIVRVDKKIISLSDDSGIGELNVENREFEISWFMKPFNSFSLSFERNSGLIAYGSKNEAAIWDINTKLEKNLLVGHQGTVQFVEISKDGHLAISCSAEIKVNLIFWNLQTSQKVAELLGHTDSVVCACFSKDGVNAASGSADKTVRTWNLREAREELVFLGHDRAIKSIKFLDDKKLLVSAGEDKKVIIWNLVIGVQHAVLNGHKQAIFKVLVTDDEKFIISCDFYNGIYIWNLNQLKQVTRFFYQEEAEEWLNENRIDSNEVKEYLKAYPINGHY